MKRKIRVLVLSQSMSYTGAPQTALLALQEMRNDIELCTVALEYGPLEEKYAELGPVFCLQKGFPGPLTSPADSVVAKARRMIVPVLRRRVLSTQWSRRLQKWNPDVIYVNTVAALPIAQMMAIPDAPMLLHIKELDSLLAQAAAQSRELLLSRPQHYLAVSNAVKQRLVEDYEVAAEKITVVNAYTREEKFDSYLKQRQERTKNPVAPFIVGGAGTTDWRKGTQLWLQMAAELRYLLGDDKVRFVWVGIGESQTDWQFRQMARLMHLEHLIEFVPVTSDPLSHFVQFDAFAMTSWEDPCPVVVIESMMMQIPVVCFDGSGGAPEEVGETSLVVQNFSPVEMAKKLAKLYQDPQRKVALGIAARERARSRFVASVQVPKIHDEIKRLASTQDESLAH